MADLEAESRRKFAEYFQNLLITKGLSKADIFDKTGVGRPTTNRHISGETLPSVGDREKYATAAGMKPAEFEAGWQGWKRPPGWEPKYKIDTNPSKETVIWHRLKAVASDCGMKVGELLDWLDEHAPFAKSQQPFPLKTEPGKVAAKKSTHSGAKRRYT